MAPNNTSTSQRDPKPATASHSKHRNPEQPPNYPYERPPSPSSSHPTVTVSISRKSSPIQPGEHSKSPSGSESRSPKTRLPSPSYASNPNSGGKSDSCQDSITKSRHRASPAPRKPSLAQLTKSASVKHAVKACDVSAETVSQCRKAHAPSSKTRRSHAADVSKSNSLKGSMKTAYDASRSGRNDNVPNHHSPPRRAQVSHAAFLDEAAYFSVLKRNTEANAQRTSAGTEVTASIYRSKSSKKAGKRGSQATLSPTKERSSAPPFQPSVQTLPKATSAARTDLAHGKTLGPEDIARFQPKPSDSSSTNKTVVPTRNTTNVQSLGEASKASRKAGQRGSQATLPATKEHSSAPSFQPSVKAPPKATSAARTDLAHGKVLGPEDIARFQPQPSDTSSTKKTVVLTRNTTNVQSLRVPTSCVTSRSTRTRQSTKLSRGLTSNVHIAGVTSPSKTKKASEKGAQASSEA